MDRLISEQAVIDAVSEWLYDKTRKESIENVIKALPSVRPQEPSGDLISRQAVMDCFKKWQPYMATRLWEFEQELSALPSVSPQPCEDAMSREELLKAIAYKIWTSTESVGDVVIGGTSYRKGV